MKILIIDDDADLLEMTARRIARKGAETFCAKNISEAAEQLQKNPDLTGIICDLFLQDGENGLNFYEQYVKGKFNGKFVLATGDDMADNRIAKYNAEDKLFCSMEKPYSVEKALEILNNSN